MTRGTILASTYVLCPDLVRAMSDSRPEVTLES